MTFVKIWIDLCFKKPLLHNPEAKIEMSVSNFKRLLEQVYNKGYEEGRNSKPDNPFGDLFGDTFGRKK